MFFIAFLTGLLGSFHCVGMCGAIALSLPVRHVWGNVVYQVGRVATYSLLGLLVGLFGWALLQIGIQQLLSITAGVMLVAMAFLPILKNNFTTKWFAPIKQKFQYFLGKKDYFSLFMIGILNGFLPCGLVWLALAAALSMVQVWEAMLYMACFGVGTIPMMLTLVFLPNIISLSWRQRIFKLIPIFTFCVGILLILRGLNLDIPYISPLLKFDTNQPVETVCE